MPFHQWKEVYFDMDDVLNKFTGYVGHYWGVGKDCDDLSWCNPKLGVDIFGCIRDAMNDQGKKFRYTISEFWDVLKFEHWANVPPCGFGIEAMERAGFLIGFDNVYIATSPTKCHHAASGKVAWIKKYLPEWCHRQYVITPRKWKLSAPGRLLVDDMPHNIEKWASHGGDGCLVKKPWNELWRMGHTL